jgi:hypothetical protein
VPRPCQNGQKTAVASGTRAIRTAYNLGTRWPILGADVIALKGDSYRLKNRDLGRVPTAAADES